MAEEETKMAAPETTMAAPIRMVAIENMVENIRYKAQILARTNKYESAILGSGIVGFAAGLLTAFILIVIPALVS